LISVRLLVLAVGIAFLDDFLINIRSYQLKIAKFADDVNNIDRFFTPSEIYYIYFYNKNYTRKIDEIYTIFSIYKFKRNSEGGFSIVYQATWLDSYKYDFVRRNDVVLKRFKNPQYAEKYFMSEVNNIRIYLYNTSKNTCILN
jgi:hypothetical protein